MKRKTKLWTWAAVLITAPTALFAQVPAVVGTPDSSDIGIHVAIIASVLALVFCIVKARGLVSRSEGTDRMVEIAGYIREGADAFLNQEYKWIAAFVLIVFLALFGVYSDHPTAVWPFPVAFLTGGIVSALAGWIGMKIATRANARTAWAAKEGLNTGLKVAFSAGSIMGMVVVGLGLIMIVMWFIVLRDLFDTTMATNVLFSFGMGASSVALFGRLGGGIYTKAADVGADLVGKVEAGIPEDDPRNPATIADNVGDNVGDVAGMGADLFESYVGSIVATMSLGLISGLNPAAAVIAPIGVAGVGIIGSMIGTFIVRTKENASQEDLLWSLRWAIYGASALVVGLAAWMVLTMLNLPVGILIAMGVGLVAGNVIGYFTEYYTSDNYQPTKDVANSAETGAATVIISGLAVGMRSTMIPVITIVIGTILAYLAAKGSGGTANTGLYGIGMAAVGMLATLGITLSTDAYGPVADNAGGIAEMAGLEPEVREKTDALDSLGNTTAATGKGFAIGSAALTALTLLAAFKNILAGENISIVTDLTDPLVLGGLFIGGMVPFLFSAMTMEAVGKAAIAMVEEVRRQFREIPGILEGTGKPDYQNCVKISTDGALRQMVVPTLLAVLTPVLTGVLLGAGGMLAMLGGALVSGFSIAIMMANAGGSWDNAKKYIERGNLGGKGSEAHKAGVVGDTVGDPFKDTSGPSINILIKLMSIVSVVFGPAIIKLNGLLF